MNPKELAQLIRDYRMKNAISQLELAQRLKFTQATVSRIEAGKQHPRSGQLEKLLKLIDPDSLSTTQDPSKKAQLPELPLREGHTHYLKTEWNCFWVSRQLDASAGGDVLLVRELKKNNQLGILIGDSVGHGKSAAYMSFALEFAYVTIASMMAPSLLIPEVFERALGAGISRTGSSWRGEPSIGIVQVDLHTGLLSCVNRGMPYPLMFESEKASFLTDKRATAFSINSPVYSEGSTKVKLGRGNSILFYTDGLLDLIPESELPAVMQNLARLFKGDSRAIGRNLIRLLRKNNVEEKASDDISFLILSRGKKGKVNAAG